MSGRSWLCRDLVQRRCCQQLFGLLGEHSTPEEANSLQREQRYLVTEFDRGICRSVSAD